MARDNRLDTLKGLLIILVIMGHVITSLDNTNRVNHAVMGLIYIFHMPLFILISGYLTKTPQQQRPREMWLGILRIALPLVIFHLISSVRGWCITGKFLVFFESFPFDILWYLLSLIYWRVAVYYTPRAILKRPALYLAIALALSVLSGLTYLGNFLSIQRALNFYLFFLLGYYYRHGAISEALWKRNAVHGVVVIVLLPLIFWLYPHCGNFMNGADHYSIADIPQKVLILACSIAMSLLVFNLTRSQRWLSRIGKDSLFFFLYHRYIISSVIVLWATHTGWPTSLPFIIFYTAVVVGILWLMSMVKILRWPVYPTIVKSQSKKSN